MWWGLIDPMQSNQKVVIGIDLGRILGNSQQEKKINRSPTYR
jgi:hypothetical protein